MHDSEFTQAMWQRSPVTYMLYREGLDQKASVNPNLRKRNELFQGVRLMRAPRHYWLPREDSMELSENC